jgi:hypothetical protein
MIYFVFIDQTISFKPAGTMHEHAVTSAASKQIQFLKELTFYFDKLKNYKFVWSSNWASDKSENFFKSVIEGEMGGLLNMLTSVDNIDSVITNPSKIYLLGGNIFGCMTNKTLPFNYYTFSKFGVVPEIVLDLCYDYTIPNTSDRELYSTLAYKCNQQNLKFIDSLSLKKQLLSK